VHTAALLEELEDRQRRAVGLPVEEVVEALPLRLVGHGGIPAGQHDGPVLLAHKELPGLQLVHREAQGLAEGGVAEGDARPLTPAPAPRGRGGNGLPDHWWLHARDLLKMVLQLQSAVLGGGSGVGGQDDRRRRPGSVQDEDLAGVGGGRKGGEGEEAEGDEGARHGHILPVGVACGARLTDATHTSEETRRARPSRTLKRPAVGPAADRPADGADDWWPETPLWP